MNTKLLTTCILTLSISLALPLQAAEKDLTTTIQSLEQVEKDMRKKAKSLPKNKQTTSKTNQVTSLKQNPKSPENSDLGIPIGLGVAVAHGAMFETGYSFTPNFNIKVYVQGFSYESDPQSISFADSSLANKAPGTTENVEYKIQWDMRSYGSNLEWFPFGNAFKLIAGVNHSEDQIQAVANLDTTVIVGTEEYEFNAGELRVIVKQKKPVSGVVGFGFGNFAKGGNFYFSSDFLMKFTEAEVVVETKGLNIPLAEKDKQKIIDDLEKDEITGYADQAFQYSLNFVLGYRL